MSPPPNRPGDDWNWTDAQRRCLGLARRYARGPEAEDVAQEALLRAWRCRSELRDGERLGGWLAAIVRNEAARYRARRRPRPVAEVEVDGPAEDERLLATPGRIDVETALGQLDDRERELLDLRYGRDLTQPAIARLLDMPEGTVKVHLHRARAKLHRALSEK